MRKLKLNEIKEELEYTNGWEKLLTNEEKRGISLIEIAFGREKATLKIWEILNTKEKFLKGEY